METFAIGIDIGGTNTDIGIVSPTGKVIGRTNLPTQQYTKANEYLEAIEHAIRQLMAEHRIPVIGSIGIGAPNSNPFTGVMVANTPNMPMKEETPFRTFLSERFGVPVAVDNDANAAAYGEYIYGGARNMRHFIMITLGTGIGSGIVIDGRLLHGHTGTAGELGHTLVQPGGRTCGCGRKGCVEMYASAKGICLNYVEAARTQGHPLSDSEIATLTCRQVGEEALKGNPVARAAYRETAYWLGIAMANAAAFSAPEAFFLMGGPTRAGEALMEPLREYFNENLLFLYKGIDIRFSQLNDNEAALLGAAALGMAPDLTR